MPEDKPKKAMLNTTIDSSVMENFREYSRELGVPMNILLESFMRQMSNGEFTLKIGKNKKIELDIEE